MIDDPPADPHPDPADPHESAAALRAEVAEARRLAGFERAVARAVVASPAGPADVPARCVGLAVEHLGVAFSRIWEVDEAGEVLEVRADDGLRAHPAGPPARGPGGAGDALPEDGDWARVEGIAAFAGFPLIAGGREVGGWEVFGRHRLGPAALEALGAAAELVARGLERGRAEARVRRECEQWSVTLASIGDGVIATDAAGRVTMLNPVARALTGWAEADAAGEPLENVFRIVNQETREPAENPALRALREGRTVGLANHSVLVARDGTERAVDDSAAPIRDAAGRVVGSVLIFRDVDERRRAERDLMRGEARKAAILDSALDAIITIDHRGHVLEWNPAAERTFGYPRAEAVGRPLAGLIVPPGLREAHRRGLSHYLATGEGPVLGKRIEIAAIRADGQVIPVELAITPIQVRGEPPTFTAHVRDISDRKRAEAAERDSLTRFRTLADSIPQLAWMAEADGHITWYNRRWHEYTGTTPERMAGWGWREVHDPAVLPEVLERWGASIRTGEPFDMTFPLRGADGVFRPFLTRIEPLRDDAGRVVQWFGTNTDLSEQKALEDSLRAARDDAERANHAKTQFLAVLSHELRTPLNPILLAASSMLDQPGPIDEFRPTMEMIRHNVNLQARLIDDLLDVMRIVQGKMPLHSGAVDCHAVIGHAVEVCQSEVHAGRVRLRLDLQARSSRVNADAARLQQVFWNLIKNAVKFSPEGGALVIRTRDEGDGDDARIVVEVADTGIGIEPHILPTIFDPFQQGEASITRRFGGMGLGLAICRGVVEAHGGTISAHSPGPGQGTTFRVALMSLPGASGAGDETGASPAVGANAAARDRPAQLRILVVEDEDATRRLMGRLLGSQGHAVTLAGGIAEGAARAAEGDVDLIISDIGLPDGSGLDLMRQVVAARGPTPAIALTGYGMEEDIVRSREAGFAAHMTKPIDFTKLEAMIRQIVD